MGGATQSSKGYYSTLVGSTINYCFKGPESAAYICTKGPESTVYIILKDLEVQYILY